MAAIPKPRILHCIPTLLVGGAERQVRLLLPQLVKQGCDCALYARLTDADIFELAQAGVNCFKVPRLGSNSLRNLLTLFQVVRDWSPNIIQTWLVQMDVMGGTIARLTKIQFILSERASLESNFPSFKYRFRRWIGAYAAAIVANSEAGTKVWPSHRKKLIISNGLDLFSIAHATLPNFDHFLPGTGAPFVITACRLDAGKDVRTVISAMDVVRRERPDLVFVVLGDGDKRPELQQQIESVGLSQNVILVGIQDNVWGWFKRAKLFVSSSLFEGQPNAVLEAAASRVPMVLSDIPAHRELFFEEEAIFVKPGDVYGFAQAILRLANSEAMQRRLSSAAFERIRHLDIDTCALKYKALYEEVLRRRI